MNAVVRETENRSVTKVIIETTKKFIFQGKTIPWKILDLGLVTKYSFPTKSLIEVLVHTVV